MKAAVIKEPRRPDPPPVVWTLAGTDPGGGAGIQADLKTLTGLGVYGCSVITAIVAQNTQGVRDVTVLDASVVRNQIRALREDFPPAAVKIGMLGTAEIVALVASELRELDVPIVCDPVVQSSSGTWLLDPGAIPCLAAELLPLCAVSTPNWPEVEWVCGQSIQQESEVEIAADAWCRRIGSPVLIKGGHSAAEELGDFWSNGVDGFWVKSSRVQTRHTHGTGCALSSALAAGLARGLSMMESLVVARAYVNQGLRTAPGLGSGHGPLGLGAWPLDPEDYPDYESVNT